MQAGKTAAGEVAPIFEVDAAWPKPLPNNWIVGVVSGIATDERDHIWMVHRPASLTETEKAAATTPPAAECCIPAPPVIEFDAHGNVVQGWGGPGPGFDWPDEEHGISVDRHNNVWITASGAKGAQILKFTRTGKFLLQIGQRGKTGGSNDTTTLGRPAQVAVDEQANEVFVADGELNRRVIVFDAETGAYKRHWGAYGEKPDDTVKSKYDPNAPASRQFGAGAVHCIQMASDGTLYVCDRSNDRFQIFHKDGTFVKEIVIAKQTLGVGSVFAIDFSPDQKFVYVGDGTNQKVWILRRDQLQIVGSFGHPGRSAGQFLRVHDLAVDSKGNMYVAEANEGRRAQKFTFKGLSSGKSSQ
jgi:DNA-binding beta-propeller fold protein YncE